LESLSNAEPWHPDFNLEGPAPSPIPLSITIRIISLNGSSDYLVSANGVLVAVQDQDLPYFEVPAEDAERIETLLRDILR
jgi:hypothetical protein